MSSTLRVCEIFRSIQGESTRAGVVCIFVRLSGCNLNCSYCDTVYAGKEFSIMTVSEVVDRVATFSGDTVEITGGEPLLQSATPELAERLVAEGKTVLVETNGSIDIGVLPAGCVKIVDVKCPSSGMCGSFLEDNIGRLESGDEVKFVIGSAADLDWAGSFVRNASLCDRCTVLFSPVASSVAPADVAQWILEYDLPVRLQVQLHKIIWGDRRGV